MGMAKQMAKPSPQRQAEVTEAQGYSDWVLPCEPGATRSHHKQDQDWHQSWVRHQSPKLPPKQAVSQLQDRHRQRSPRPKGLGCHCSTCPESQVHLQESKAATARPPPKAMFTSRSIRPCKAATEKKSTSTSPRPALQNLHWQPNPPPRAQGCNHKPTESQDKL